MGLDVEAYIVVGLPIDQLNIEEMPLYEENSEWSWRDLSEVYYSNEAMFGLRVREVHRQCGDEQRVLGFMIAETGSYDILALDPQKLRMKISGASTKFIDIIGRVPGVYLMPRMW